MHITPIEDDHAQPQSENLDEDQLIPDENEKLIQQQLVLFLHVIDCQLSETQFEEKRRWDNPVSQLSDSLSPSVVNRDKILGPLTAYENQKLLDIFLKNLKRGRIEQLEISKTIRIISI
ncbi:hypothetical protein J6590_034302 [Homalodisca vitripennis]|nr:hypothetical protein J6590_034302 [Homalodisca vitripennis]